VRYCGTGDFPGELAGEVFGEGVWVGGGSARFDLDDMALEYRAAAGEVDMFGVGLLLLPDPFVSELVLPCWRDGEYEP
jgi:hypothetical protein